MEHTITKNKKANYVFLTLIAACALTAGSWATVNGSTYDRVLPETRLLSDSIKKTIVGHKASNFFMVYQGSGATNAYGSFSQSNTQPSDCGGSTKICWLRVEDTDNDGTISSSEFQSAFNAHDSNSNGSLDDESAVTGQLSIRD